MHQRVHVGYYLLAFGHTEWPVWETALHQMTMFCYRGTAWPCWLQGVPLHQLCRLGPGPSGGKGDVGIRFGQGRGDGGGCRVEWGTQGDSLEQSIQRKREGEGGNGELCGGLVPSLPVQGDGGCMGTGPCRGCRTRQKSRVISWAANFLKCLL